MINQYTQEEFERFARGIKKVSDILRSEKPDYIFAPIIGSVPLVDLLFIADRHFNLDTVEYPPNSSRFSNREDIMSQWYENFLKTNYNGEKIRITCVDEVISGSSAVKGHDEFKKALYDFAGQNSGGLVKKVSYNILGVGELPRNNKRNHRFSKLVNAKKAKVIEVGKILTADNPDLNPLRLKTLRKNSQGRFIYVPEIETFEISEEYVTLLQDFARFMGVDPSTVSLQNIGRIRESLEKYLGQ